MPDAYAQIEPSGIYFFDNAGARQILENNSAFATVGLH